MTPFDHFKSLSKSKVYEDDLSEYVPYVVNTAFSMHEDTIMLANEMNMLHELPPVMQYDFYFYAVRPRSRYAPWPKKKHADEDLLLIQEYYKYSARKARHALSLLSEDQLEYIRTKMFKGGPA